MTFESTVWLLITPILALCIGGIIVFGAKRRDSLLSQFAAARLLPKLTEKANARRVLIKAACIVIAATGIGLAIARPQYGIEWTERKTRSLDIVFVLDTSKSMLATDLRPSRLERAKLAIRDLVNQLESDRIGLVAFSGRAFLQTPPTLDYTAFRESLDAVEPGIMSRGGSDLGSALKEAARAFPQDNNYKAVVLLTDGEDLGGRAIQLAKEAAEEGIRVYAIGIGTPEGEYLRIQTLDGKEEFIRDNAGQPVRSQLDEATLAEVAKITGGSYTRLSGNSLQTLYNSVLATLPRSERESELEEARIERFQWPLSAAIIFLILDIFIRRRSGATAAILVTSCCLMLSPVSTKANEGTEDDEFINDTLSTPTESSPEDTKWSAHERYNRATQTLQDGDYAAAEEAFKETIIQTENRQIQRDALYNQALSVFQRGDTAFQSQDFETAIELWKEAESIFDSANQIDTEDIIATQSAEKVRARREALEAFLQQQQDPEQNQDESSENSEDQEGDSQDSQNQSKDGQDGDESEEEGSESDSEQQDSESSQENSESQSGDESEEGEESEESQSSGEEGEENSEGSPEANDGEETSDEEAMNDIPQEGEEESTEQGEEISNPSEPNGESTESEGENAQMGLPSEETLEEGMTEMDAFLLLDSLVDKERLLPFVDQPPPPTGKSKEIKDW